jgi:hypothetical protein
MSKINYNKINIFITFIIIILFIIYYCINDPLKNEYFDFRIHKSSSSKSSSPSSSPSSSITNSPISTPMGTPLRIPTQSNNRRSSDRNSRRNGRRNGRDRRNSRESSSLRKIVINNNNTNNNKIRNLDEPMVADNYPYTYGTYPYPLLGYNNYYNNGLFYYDNPFNTLPMNSYDMVNIPIYQSYQDDIVPNYRDTYSSIGNNNYYFGNNRFPPPVQDWCWKIISYKDFNLVPTASRKQWIEKAKKYNFNHIQFPRDRTDYILVPTWEISECYINKFGDDSMFQEVLLE